MKTIIFLFKMLVIFSPFIGVAQEKNFGSYISVGNDFSTTGVLSASQLDDLYKGLKPGDSVAVRFRADVSEVCKAKGCWMKTELGDGREVMIKFRDYAFFVPKDISGKEFIVNGMAYVAEMSAEEQQHYAEDAGKSAEEIAQLSTPKRTLSFLADGVKIEKEQ